MTQHIDNAALEVDSGSSEWFNEEEKLPWWGGVAKCLLKTNKIPKHIAFVMDGNRRYARKCQLSSVIQGHSMGFDQMTKILEWCRDLGVLEVTVYAFSIENFKRDEREVSGLMKMAEQKFERLLADKSKLEEKQIFAVPKIQRLVAEIEQLTRKYKKGFVNVCLAYTSQNEISRAMEWIRKGTQLGFIEEDDIDERLISDCLDTRQSNEVDMLIRTSGERRLSDFLLYQCSKCYIHFEDVLWPELSFWHLFKAILQYQHSLSFIQNLEESPLQGSHSDAKSNTNSTKFLEWMEEERLKERNIFLVDL
uniref:Alkyl transferase n=1 Tax=Ditylenchus dipsaci TaxID=166011 RepID=A0A915E043_9BILA